VSFWQKYNVKEIINIEVEVKDEVKTEVEVKDEVKTEVKVKVKMDSISASASTYLKLSILLLHLRTLRGFSSVG
jgi:hypothetical protein